MTTRSRILHEIRRHYPAVFRAFELGQCLEEEPVDDPYLHPCESCGGTGRFRAPFKVGDQVRRTEGLDSRPFVVIEVDGRGWCRQPDEPGSRQHWTNPNYLELCTPHDQTKEGT